MSGVSAFLEIIRHIFTDILTINVPGTDFSFWHFLVTVVLAVFAISLVRFLFSLPVGAAVSSVKGDYKRSLQGSSHNNKPSK